MVRIKSFKYALIYILFIFQIIWNNYVTSYLNKVGV